MNLDELTWAWIGTGSGAAAVEGNYRGAIVSLRNRVRADSKEVVVSDLYAGRAFLTPDALIAVNEGIVQPLVAVRADLGSTSNMLDCPSIASGRDMDIMEIVVLNERVYAASEEQPSEVLPRLRLIDSKYLAVLDNPTNTVCVIGAAGGEAGVKLQDVALTTGAAQWATVEHQPVDNDVGVDRTSSLIRDVARYPSLEVGSRPS